MSVLCLAKVIPALDRDVLTAPALKPSTTARAAA